MKIEILDKMPEKIERPTFHIYPTRGGAHGLYLYIPNYSGRLELPERYWGVQYVKAIAEFFIKELGLVNPVIVIEK